MSLRNSVHKFILRLPALLLGAWLVLVIILIFRDQGCEETYGKWSFPALICSVLSESSSLR
ncbi:hypothetical protein GQG94_004599 [Salmonella enterica]|nr:hypothetical protein [Salmonella enterica subsp. enterica serovar Mbandaka]EEJ1220302.1 hypothetical protein [Salmonella enterica]